MNLISICYIVQTCTIGAKFAVASLESDFGEDPNNLMKVTQRSVTPGLNDPWSPITHAKISQAVTVLLVEQC